MQQKLDPITFGVLRHKLDAIITEAYYTIGRVSGSTVVYEAGDHQEAICTPTGDLAAFGAGVLHWTKSINEGVKHIIETYKDNPGFNDGDQFLFNDPYIAAIHASDVQVLAPVFYQGEIIAWAGSASHQTDVGGIDVGSICISAQDFYQEGFITPGLKIVDRGVIRKDVEDTFRNVVRVADLGLLDIRAKIASNNVIRDRLVKMVERYGLDTVKLLFQQLIEYSEARVRARLAEIPNGEWTSINYVEGIKQPTIKMQITAIKENDHLTLDFTGSSPQTADSANSGMVGAMSSAMNPFIAMLCHDIPWNQGLFKAVDFVLPPGSVVNPQKPAAVSANVPAGANILIMTTAHNVLSKMLLSSEKYRNEACGNIGGGFNIFVLSGNNRDGTFFATLILDNLASGMGALPDRDGADTAQNHWCVKTMIANIETNEMLYPILFLWRKEIPDSGGAGKLRGGVGIGDALIPWNVEQLANVNLGCGAEPRNCLGLSGGYPASHTPVGVMRGAKIQEVFFAKGKLPSTLEDLGGNDERLGSKSLTTFSHDDVLYGYMGAGGGGFGDPLERETHLVLNDVLTGAVSEGIAHDIYGVVLTADGLAVDHAATTVRRDAIRQNRLERIKSYATSA